jgi:hypothetical protein
MPAFSHSIASSGNHFEHRHTSRSLRLAPTRDVPFARPRRLCGRSRPKLSVVSVSRPAWVNGCCERSTGCG